MEIGPVSGNEARQQPQRSDRAQKTAEPARTHEDRVEISSDARALLSEAADNELKVQGREFGPVAETGDDRSAYLEAIRRRIRNGYYNRPDVRDSIVDKLMDDLHGNNRAKGEK